MVDIQRAEIMQDLRRYDEALEIFRAALVREPLNPDCTAPTTTSLPAGPQGRIPRILWSVFPRAGR